MPEQGYRIGDVLDHVRQEHDVEAPPREPLVRHRPLDQLNVVQARCSRHQFAARFDPVRGKPALARQLDEQTSRSADVEERGGARMRLQRLLDQPAHLEHARVLAALVARIDELLVEPEELTQVAALGEHELAAQTAAQREGRAVVRVGDLEVAGLEFASNAALLVRRRCSEPQTQQRASSADWSLERGLSWGPGNVTSERPTFKGRRSEHVDKCRHHWIQVGLLPGPAELDPSRPSFARGDRFSTSDGALEGAQPQHPPR